MPKIPLCDNAVPPLCDIPLEFLPGGCRMYLAVALPGSSLSSCPAVSFPVPHQEPYLLVADKVQLLGWLENCSNCSLNSSSFLMVTISVLLC